jgi:septation ring formation regulator EzrA
MEKIREHIEGSLNDAKREYDDVYYHWSEATEAFKRIKTELESLTSSLAYAEKNMEYYQKLLTELNENDTIKNK